MDDQLRVAITPARAVSVFGVTVIGYLTANLAPLMIVSLVTVYAVSTTAAGTILTASLLATAVTGLATAGIAAGRHRPALARIGCLVAAGGFGIAALSPPTWVGVGGIVVGGAGGGACIAAAGAALAALRDPDRAAGMLGISNRSLVAVVLAVAPLFGAGMGASFGAVALLAVVALLVVGWMPAAPVARPGGTATGPTRGTDADPAAPSTLWAGRTLLVCFALWAVGEDSLWSMVPVMGSAQAGVGTQLSGVILSVSTATGIGAGLVVAVLGRRLGRTVPIVVLVVLGSLLKVVVGFVTDPTVFTVVVICWNTVYAAAFLYFVAIAAALDVRGRWAGAIGGAYLFGSAFAPTAGAVLSDLVGFRVFGVVLAAVGTAALVPTVVVAGLSRRVERAQAAVTGADARPCAPAPEGTAR